MAGVRHDHDTTIDWTHDWAGTLTAPGRRLNSGGTDDVWSPEHLCVAAVNACVMLTFVTTAQSWSV